MDERFAITALKHLLVEGRDQVAFFRAFLERLEIDDVQIHDFGGVNDLTDFLEIFVALEEFEGGVASIGIVRDAERRPAQSALQSVQGSLRRVGLPVPQRLNQPSEGYPTVNVFVLPDNQSAGMLETLLCRTFADTPLDKCIDQFFDCVAADTGAPIHRPEKARAHAYIAVQRDPLVSVWVAAQRGYWNLDHPAFNQIRAFLRTL